MALLMSTPLSAIFSNKFSDASATAIFLSRAFPCPTHFPCFAPASTSTSFQYPVPMFPLTSGLVITFFCHSSDRMVFGCLPHVSEIVTFPAMLNCKKSGTFPIAALPPMPRVLHDDTRTT